MLPNIPSFCRMEKPRRFRLLRVRCCGKYTAVALPVLQLGLEPIPDLRDDSRGSGKDRKTW
jgi:hypothetical protein